MMQHPKFRDADLSRLQISGVGGAPCALAILEGWLARGVKLVQGWGMTETSPAGTMLDAADADPQGRLGRQGDDAHRDPHRRRPRQRRSPQARSASC
jgi:acyl-CoA synthetase (AMP-forming)/AMP-acid ligase II